MNVIFKLGKFNKKDECVILIRYKIKDFDFQYSTGIKIKRSEWNGKLRKIKSYPDKESQLNIYLSTLNKIVSSAQINEIPLSKEYLKSELDKIFKNIIEKPKETSVVQLLSEYIADLYKANDFAKGTIKKYQIVYNILNDMNCKLDIKDVNYSFYKDFISFCRNERQNQNSTIGKNTATLKAFLRQMKLKGHEVSDDIDLFKKLDSTPTEVALTENELFRIYNHDLTGNRAIVRDLFCFGAFTGMRFSDYSQLDKAIIKDDSITILTQKTTDVVNVPLNKYAKSILNRYDGSLPKFSNQFINREIKSICKEVGIDEPIQKTILIGKTRKTTIKPKYKFISTHTGRRTFITIALLKNTPIPILMKFTGQKKVETVMKYAKVTDSEILAKHQLVFN